ncbi:MAG TPA: nucleoside hydrolase, partial [Opitutaceae bacterium]|nr:nucleoside hydrolase [Opitutaceae bacterium]
PELDLKMVLTDTGDTTYRATVAAKFLEAAGRTDVAIGIGLPGELEESNRTLDPWIRGYNLADYPGTVHQDGIDAFIELVMNSPETVTVIAIGGVPGLAAALEREPRIAAKARFVGMHGSFDVGYGGSPDIAAEANVRVAPDALRKVLSAPWQEKLLTSLDTCGLSDIRGADYRRIWCATDDAAVNALIEGYAIFAPRVPWMHCDFFTTRSTTLFDCVAVHLAYSEKWVEIETVRFHITDDGFTIRDPAGPHEARVALRWTDRAAYETDLANRLLAR